MHNAGTERGDYHSQIDHFWKTGTWKISNKHALY